MICACVSDDAYECWADRYNLGMADDALVKLDGGPCKCACHTDDAEDDDEYFYPLDDSEK